MTQASRIPTRSLPALAGLVLFAAAAPAQYVNPSVRPGYTAPVPNGRLAPVAPPAARAPGYVARPYPVPVPAYGGYGYGIGNAQGSYLSGASDVINAQGNYWIQREQSRQQREVTKQARVDTQRKIFDEWQYEQSRTPSYMETKMKNEAGKLQMMRISPTETAIRNGDAANTLLTAIQRAPVSPGGGPNVPLSPGVLAAVNVSDGRTYGPGLLRNGGKLTWPTALRTEGYQDIRESFDTMMPKAVTQARSGQLDPGLSRDLGAAWKDLQARMQGAAKSASFTDWVAARAFADQLGSAVDMLTGPNATSYLDGSWMPKGDNVGALVDNLTNSGLKFGPATQGGEGAYSGLYRALLAYDRAVNGGP